MSYENSEYLDKKNCFSVTPIRLMTDTDSRERTLLFIKHVSLLMRECKFNYPQQTVRLTLLRSQLLRLPVFLEYSICPGIPGIRTGNEVESWLSITCGLLTLREVNCGFWEYIICILTPHLAFNAAV